MIIKNGYVFTEEGKFEQKDLYIEGTKFVADEAQISDRSVYDACGCKILPGLVDVHSHGAAGCDFGDANAKHLEKILAYEKAHGITSYCPTSMTVSKEELLSIFPTVLEAKQDKEHAKIAGIHMEGPFVSAAKKGAQNEKHIKKASVSFFEECNQAAGGRIKVLTMAPEEEGAMEFIREMHNKVNISLGHTCTDYETAKEAFGAGANHVTHLFNAMNPIGHRAPGLIGAAVDDDRCMVEIISDGMHIHPAVVKMMFKAIGAERMVLISDSLSATGLEDGMYELGGQPVIVKDGKATLEDGTIAGSTTNLYDCMCRAMSFGVPEADAIFAATRNPARSIGIYDKTGSLVPGKAADLLIVDQDYQLKDVCINGEF
jgi:N-acetylglucosamine-6-phosphate deacetylase